jgi:hypothetical protein
MNPSIKLIFYLSGVISDNSFRVYTVTTTVAFCLMPFLVLNVARTLNCTLVEGEAYSTMKKLEPRVELRLA